MLSEMTLPIDLLVGIALGLGALLGFKKAQEEQSKQKIPIKIEENDKKRS